MVSNKSFIFEKIPEGYPVPGQDIIVKDIDTDIENAPEGGVVTKNLYVPLRVPYSFLFDPAGIHLTRCSPQLCFLRPVPARPHA